MGNPFDQFDNQAGPVYGPPPVPKLPTPQTPAQAENDMLTNEKLRGDLQTAPLDLQIKQGQLAEQQAKAAQEQRKVDAQNLDLDNTKAEILGVIRDAREAQAMSHRFFASGFGSTIAKKVEGTPARDLDTLLSHIGANTAFDRLQRMRQASPTGGAVGNVSDTDIKLLKDSVGSLDQGASDPRFRANLENVISHYARVYEGIGGDPEMLKQALAGTPDAHRQDVTGSQNGFNETPNDEAGAFLDSLVRQGIPYSQAQALYQQKFPGFKGPNGEPGFSPKQYRDAVLFARQHPNDYHPTQAIDRVPLTPGQEIGNAVAGSPMGAFAGNALNAATAGLPAAVAGDQGQDFLQASRAQNPNPSAAGDLIGSVGGMLGIEGGLARAGMKAGLGRELVANSGYGAVRGAAENPEDPTTGAIVGGLSGAGGTLGGRAVIGTAGALVSPSGGTLAGLYERGIRPTPGQRALAAGGGQGLAGLAGRAVNATEEAFQSLPVAGAAIHGARQEARDQFQIAAFNEALKDVGDQLPKGMRPGNAPHAYTQNVFRREYDKARSGMRVQADDELAQELGEVAGVIDTLAPESATRFYRILENKVLPKIQNTLEGDAYKKVQSNLGQVIRNIRSSKTGDDELAGALEDLQHALDNAARRHSDPESVKLLDAADRGYAKFVRIEEAAKARGGDSGTFTPTQFDRAIQKNARGPRSREYLRGDALMQDFAEQAAPLSDRMGNSFTTDRALAAGTVLTAGAGYVSPGTLGLVGALATLYAPGIRRGVKAAMKPRGPKAKAIADAIRKLGPYAGTAGSAYAVQGASPAQ